VRFDSQTFRMRKYTVNKVTEICNILRSVQYMKASHRPNVKDWMSVSVALSHGVVVNISASQVGSPDLVGPRSPILMGVYRGISQSF